MKITKSSIDRDYLKRCKKSTPETKLRWLASARELACAKKQIRKR